MRTGCIWLHDRVKWPEDFVLWGVGIFDRREGEYQIIPPAGPFFSQLLPPSLHTLIVNHDRVGLRINGERTVFPPGSSCVWDMSGSVFYGEAGVAWSLSYLQVNGSRFEEWLTDLSLDVNRSLNWLDSSTIEYYLARILYECEHYVEPDIAILQNLLYGLLLEIKRADTTRSTTQPKIPSRIREIKDYLDENYSKQVRFGQLAESFQFSPAYLSRKFKNCYHKRPVDYLIDLRLRHASKLLVVTDDQVGEISRQVGFTDVFHFSKTFKKRIGCSPKAYREENRRTLGPSGPLRGAV